MKPADLMPPDTPIRCELGFDENKPFASFSYPAHHMVLVTGNPVILSDGRRFICVKTGDYHTAELLDD